MYNLDSNMIFFTNFSPLKG